MLCQTKRVRDRINASLTSAAELYIQRRFRILHSGVFWSKKRVNNCRNVYCYQLSYSMPNSHMANHPLVYKMSVLQTKYCALLIHNMAIPQCNSGVLHSAVNEPNQEKGSDKELATRRREASIYCFTPSRLYR